MIRILTDSAADLTEQEQAQPGVAVAPMAITFEDGTTIEDDGRMTKDEFFARLAADAKLPRTSQPSPAAFIEEYADAEAAGTLTLVYDHHKNDLARKLTRMQHDDHDIIITTLHVHLDHHNCLEVLVLKGDAGRVRALADRLVSCKGVKHGTFSGTTTGQDLA